jgi:CheY-like chemotaxis protein
MVGIATKVHSPSNKITILIKSPFLLFMVLVVQRSQGFAPVTMGTKTVLLINSEPNVREVMQACLIHIGEWQVFSTGSPMEGLQRAVQDQPDAIIFDLSTLGMSFVTFLNQLRDQPETRSIPVVLIAPGEKWLDFQVFRKYQVVGMIDDVSDPGKFSTQIAKLLNWWEDLPRTQTEDYGSEMDAED